VLEREGAVGHGHRHLGHRGPPHANATTQ
jgi:hypothetical protein